MPRLLDFLNGTDTQHADFIATQAENALLRNHLDSAEIRIDDLEESLLEIADAFDNIGWSPLDSQSATEMPLGTVKKASEVARAMLAVNPFVKAGVEARIAYIWGNGVDFDKLEDSTKKIMKKNRKILFSPQGYAERERIAATDGNVFTALHRDDTSMFRIPLAQIAGSVSNPENAEEIWYYKRQWKVRKTNSTNGVEKDEEFTRYYPSLSYATKLEDSGKAVPKRWGKFGVDQNYVIQHEAVNKQVGWRWGVPDIMPVIFFAKVYKEYLEDNVTLVKAYSRIANQVKAPTQATANSAAVQIGSTPTRDPITGEMRSVGATAITGLQTELVPTGLSGSQVDFSNGSPLAAGIAAGLEVSLDDVMPGENPTAGGISVTTLRAMESRQQLWGDSFVDLFEFWGDEDVEVTWRNIDEDETHRRVQSVQLAYDGGLLHQEEARKEVLEMLRIVPTSDEMPVAPAIEAAEVAAEQAAEVAKATPTVVPGQGKSGSVGSVNSGKGQVKQAVKKSMNQ
jgi:hypothetical protein